MILCYIAPEIRHMADVIVIFHLWLFFALLPHVTAQKIKISKNQPNKKKNTWRYHFKHAYQKLWLHDVRFLRYGARRTDGRKKWHINMGVPPRKNQYFEQSATPFGIKKKNSKANSLIQTLMYRSNMYYSKIYQREDWKKKKNNNSSTLHL